LTDLGPGVGEGHRRIGASAGGRHRVRRQAGRGRDAGVCRPRTPNSLRAARLRRGRTSTPSAAWPYTAFQVRSEAHGVPFTEKEVPRGWRPVLARATSSIADQRYESADRPAHVPQLPESREALPLAAQFPQDARSVLSHHRVRWSVDLGGACAQMPGRGRPPAARRSPALSPGARAFLRGHESTVHFFTGRERFACARGSMWLRTGKALSPPKERFEDWLVPAGATRFLCSTNEVGAGFMPRSRPAGDP